MVKGDAVSDCQPICKPIAWLVLPTGCIAVILFDSAVQSLDSPISDTGQEVYCSVGYNVLPAIGTSLVVSKFWSRSVTQPFQVVWFAGVQILPFATQLLCVWKLVLLQVPFTASHRSQRSQVCATVAGSTLTSLLKGMIET